MNKKITAGVAALALSMAPVAGVLAVDCTGDGGSLTDNISLTISGGCTFTRSAPTSGNGSNGTFTLSMNWNAVNTSLTETFKVVCNDAAGFKVTGTFTSFTSTGKTAIAYSTTTPTAGSGTWTATKGAASATTNMTSGSSGNLMSETSGTSTSGKTQQVTYKIGTGAQQERGSYTATANYVAVSNT